MSSFAGSDFFTSVFARFLCGFGTAVCRQGVTGVSRGSGILGDMAFLLFEMGREGGRNTDMAGKAEINYLNQKLNKKQDIAASIKMAVGTCTVSCQTKDDILGKYVGQITID